MPGAARAPAQALSPVPCACCPPNVPVTMETSPSQRRRSLRPLVQDNALFFCRAGSLGWGQRPSEQPGPAWPHSQRRGSGGLGTPGEPRDGLVDPELDPMPSRALGRMAAVLVTGNPCAGTRGAGAGGHSLGSPGAQQSHPPPQAAHGRTRQLAAAPLLPHLVVWCVHPCSHEPGSWIAASTAHNGSIHRGQYGRL